MDLSDITKYGDFGFRNDYVHDPNDPTSIYNARKMVHINVDYLPIHQQIRAKRIIEGFDQSQLGKIVGLPASTISLIETGQRLIPKKSLKAFEYYLYDCWYVDGILHLDRSEDDEEEYVEPMLSVEEQRAQWKAVFDNEPDMWGTIQ